MQRFVLGVRPAGYDDAQAGRGQLDQDHVLSHVICKKKKFFFFNGVI